VTQSFAAVAFFARSFGSPIGRFGVPRGLRLAGKAAP